MRKWAKKEQCYGWKNQEGKCIYGNKCTFFCSNYYRYIGGISNKNDYLNIIHSKHSRKLARLSLIISFFALIIPLTTSTVTIVTKSNDKVVKVTNGLYESFMDYFHRNIYK